MENFYPARAAQGFVQPKPVKWQEEQISEVEHPEAGFPAGYPGFTSREGAPYLHVCIVQSVGSDCVQGLAVGTSPCTPARSKAAIFSVAA